MKQTLIHKLFYAYLGAIFISSIIPLSGVYNETSIPIIFHVEFRLDYLIHTSIYAGIFFIYPMGKWLGVSKVENSSPLRKIILWAFSLGVGTEFLQLILPYRAFNPADMLANVSGICVGVLGYFMFRKQLTIQT